MMPISFLRSKKNGEIIFSAGSQNTFLPARGKKFVHDGAQTILSADYAYQTIPRNCWHALSNVNNYESRSVSETPTKGFKMKLPIYALLGITTLTFACGEEGEKIETSQVHKIVAQNAENAVNTTLTNADFLENSDVIEKIFGATGQTCEPATPGSNEINCSQRELGLDFANFELDRAEVSQYLQQTVFKESNVETSTDTEITYLIDGESICGASDPMFPSDCATQVDKAQIRLVVSSPEPNAVDIDVLVGPNRDNPISAEFHSDLLALEADLDGAEGAIGYLQSQGLIENDLQLPTTFDGRLRAEVKVEGPKKISSSASVLRAINVAGGDFGLKIGANEPTIKITLDGVAETLSVLADVGAAQVRFTEEGQTFEFDIAGVDGQAVLSAASDAIAFTGIGLGDAQSTLKLDGTTALSFDLNADAGRHIDFTVSPDADGVKVDFADSVKMALGLSFDDEDAPAYVKDDILNVELDGTTPSLIFKNGEILEVLAGTLNISLEKAGDSIEATSGQCMSPFAETGIDESSDGETEELETNIIEDMALVSCD